MVALKDRPALELTVRMTFREFGALFKAKSKQVAEMDFLAGLPGLARHICPLADYHLVPGPHFS